MIWFVSLKSLLLLCSRTHKATAIMISESTAVMPNGNAAMNLVPGLSANHSSMASYLTHRDFLKSRKLPLDETVLKLNSLLSISKTLHTIIR